MEQELDIPMRDRFHKNITEEELIKLTEVKNYPAEPDSETETDIETLKTKIKELEKRG